MPVRIISEEGAGAPSSRVRIIEPPPKRAPPRKAKGGVMETVTGFLANANRGMGIGDELAAGIGTAGGVVSALAKGQPVSIPRIGARFEAEMAQQRKTEDGYMAQHPLAANFAKGAGLATSMLAPAGGTAQVLANGSRAVNMARGAATAGVTAGAYALADRGTLQERAAAAGRAAVDPVTLALGAGASLLGPARPRAPKSAPRKAAPVPSVDELRTAKTAAYAKADQAGVRFQPEAAKGLAGDIRGLVDNEGGPELYPLSDAMAKRIDAVIAKGDLSLSTLDKLRSQVGEKVMKGPANEARIGGMMRDRIDELIDDQASVIAPEGTDAAALIRAARELNARYRKVQEVTNRLDSADLRVESTYAGGNANNAIRQNLRPLIDPKSPQRMKNLTPEESRALNRAVRGSASQNAVRAAGKFLDPRGIVGGLMQAGMGLGTGGLSMPSAFLGMAATAAGNKMTRQNVEEVLRVMAQPNVSGAQLQAIDAQLAQVADPMAQALRAQIATKLARLGGATGAAAAAPPMAAAAY